MITLKESGQKTNRFRLNKGYWVLFRVNEVTSEKTNEIDCDWKSKKEKIIHTSSQSDKHSSYKRLIKYKKR